MGTITFTKVTTEELVFTLTLANGNNVNTSASPASTENKAFSIYALKMHTINSDYQIIKINPETGNKEVFIDNTADFEYVDYYAENNEFIGFTKDDNFYYFTKVNLSTKAVTNFKLAIYDGNLYYDDFIIADGKAYVMKKIHKLESDSYTDKSQLVEIDINNGTEKIIKDNINWCKYIAYNKSKKEILGISDENDKNELCKINVGSGAESKIDINSDYDKTSYDDVILINNKLYAFKRTINNIGDSDENYQLVEIDIATGKEIVTIDNIKWCEYLKYNSNTNEIIGLTDDNDEGKYYISLLSH